MITHLRRFIGIAPTRGKISLPAALLVLGIALSCSTACITSAVVDTVATNHRETLARNAMAESLARNIQERSNGQWESSLNRDPLSIEQALGRALPKPRSFYADPATDRVKVSLTQDSSGREIYTIQAYGDFIQPYAEAFAEYAGHLRTQLGSRPVFYLEVWRVAGGRNWPVLKRELR
jgi:hypothetical protein